MATLVSKLQEAAMEGSVEKLLELLQQDPLLLDAAVDDPPLHVAVLHGHANFTIEILRRKPQLAQMFDSKGSSPLHLAAAEGHVEIVRLLLKVDSRTCLFRNADCCNPLQLAALNGHIDALKELVEARPEAARARAAVDRGGNALHLCVKNNQLDALKVMVVHAVDDQGFLYSKDDLGCSILHLAVSYKQIETIKFLDNTIGMELETPVVVTPRLPPPAGRSNSENSSWGQRWYENGEGGERRLMRQREALMVVASVVAAMAFQAAINPPGSLWKDAGKSTTHPLRFSCFVASITFSFVFSIIELFLLISDFASTIPLFLRILSFANILSIGGMAVAYGVAVFCLT